MAQSKNNLAPLGKFLTFCIEDGTVKWLSECELSADEVLAGCNISDTSKVSMAEDYLIEKLSDGMMLSVQLISEAEQLGISKRTLKSAKPNPPIRSLKKINGWYWEMTKE